jgi:outer membrane protein OmpA-like peptidoglycan-associated protein
MSQEKKRIDEQEALEGALSPIINKLIDKNFENSGDKIASQMAPLIGGAIREQIKNQKDDIVDALYPVMGNMISKFVTKSLEELLNKINQQIQNGLSIAAFKRKIQAKIQGVSESELLLQESSEAKIKAALLIHKESGTLLAKALNTKDSLGDTDMLASMMTAIRSFVNEWVESESANSELGEIEYGGNKIIIEASGYSYLAIIVEGAAFSNTYERIRAALEKVVLEYGKEIKSFNGDFTDFPKEAVQKILQGLITENEKQSKEENKKRGPFLLLFIFLLILSPLTYFYYKNYQDDKLTTKLQTLLHNTPALNAYNIQVSAHNGRATLTGALPFAYHKKLTQKLVRSTAGVKSVDNKLIVRPTLVDPMQVSAQIAYLLSGLNSDKETNLTYNFDYNTLILKGNVKDPKTKEYLLNILHKMSGIERIVDHTNITPPVVNAAINFSKASSRLSTIAKSALQKIARQLQERNITAALEVQAYSDMIGTKEVNQKLNAKRIARIKRFLQQHNLPNEIKEEIFDRPPPGIDVKKEPQKARIVTLKLQQKGAK